MIITQEELIKEVAAKEDINVTTVRRVFKSAESSIFDYLSSTTPSDKMVIKVLNGLSLDSEYVPEHKINKGLFQNYNCSEKIKVKPSVTKYYSSKLNEKF